MKFILSALNDDESVALNKTLSIKFLFSVLFSFMQITNVTFWHQKTVHDYNLCMYLNIYSKRTTLIEFSTLAFDDGLCTCYICICKTNEVIAAKVS